MQITITLSDGDEVDIRMLNPHDIDLNWERETVEEIDAQHPWMIRRVASGFESVTMVVRHPREITQHHGHR